MISRRPAVPDISVVVTGHREGAGALPTLAALARSVAAAVNAGLSVEVMGVLDRADEATTAVFASALAGGGVVGRLAPGRTVATDHGDPGAARNEGIRHAHAAWVCVLDGDNLPSRTWLREAHRAATGHGAPCVVHPEQLVIFGQRWQVWPQLPTDHPGFRAHNFFDRTYWDTFCLAAREVFSSAPYAATAADRGLGPEDWHWGMETVHAGIPHLVAPGTALLYRDKPAGSVQGAHEEARSLLPPSPLLIDRRLAATLAADHGHREWRGLQAAIVRDSRTPGRTHDGLAPEFDALHFRALTANALRMSDDEALRHYLDVGRARGLRAVLTAAELRDVASLHLDDYAALHPDLAGLDDDALLHHYLAHGRHEGRAISRTAEEREVALPVALDDELVAELTALRELEPAIPDPTPENLEALRRVGPPSDGSVTRGSRAWWRVVEAIGTPPPRVIAFVSGPPPSDPGTDARCAALLSGGPPGRVAVIVTRGSSTRPGSAGDHVAWVDLSAMDEWRQLPEPERRRLLATLVVQHRPETVRVLGSPEFSAALEAYGPALRASTSVVLDTGN